MRNKNILNKSKDKGNALEPILSENEIATVQALAEEEDKTQTEDKETAPSCSIEFVTSPEGKRVMKISGSCTVENLVSEFGDDIDEIQVESLEDEGSLTVEDKTVGEKLGEVVEVLPSSEGNEGATLAKVTRTEKKEYIVLPEWVRDIIRMAKQR